MVLGQRINALVTPTGRQKKAGLVKNESMFGTAPLRAIGHSTSTPSSGPSHPCSYTWTPSGTARMFHSVFSHLIFAGDIPVAWAESGSCSQNFCQHDGTGFRGLWEGRGSAPVVLAHRAGEVSPGGQVCADRRLGLIQDTLKRRPQKWINCIARHILMNCTWHKHKS